MSKKMNVMGKSEEMGQDELGGYLMFGAPNFVSVFHSKTIGTAPMRFSLLQITS